MNTIDRRYKIVYCTPALYMAGGVERVLTLKANYFAEHLGYDITIILTEGKGKPLFYPLSDKITIINLDINFEELWSCSFVKKVFVYLWKQRKYKKLLTRELWCIRPDITISLLRREINFITSIRDGSRKIGELHINRAHYRNFERGRSSAIKDLFSSFWMRSLVRKLQKLDQLVVLTDKDKEAWPELKHVIAIPNPLSFEPEFISNQKENRVIAVGRYCHEKGYDNLLQAWSSVQSVCPNWRLEIFGDGDRTMYEALLNELHIDRNRCVLNGRTTDIQAEFVKSSLAVCSSRFEGFGLAIVEAMACGVPVVSFDCPWGPGSIIRNGEDGLLVENGNVKQLADGILLLINDSDERLRMSRAAIQNVQRYKIDQIAKNWKQLFEEIS